MISVNEALLRSAEQWSNQRSHTENETAYQDRACLAAEVRRLRTELSAMEEAMAECDREVADLTNTIERSNWM